MAALVRVIEDPSNAFADLEINSTGTGSTWVTIGELEGLHLGDPVQVLLDPALGPSTIAVQAANATGSPPQVTAITPSQAEASVGQRLTLTLAMSEPVTVTAGPDGGLPGLSMSDGSAAFYDPGLSNPATGKLVFDDTARTSTPDLQIAAAFQNGSEATVEDAAGNLADFSAVVDAYTGLQIGPAFVTALTPSNYDDISSSGDLATGQSMILTLTMSQGVTVDTANGSPTLTLNDGGAATYDPALSDPAAGTLAFAYTVAAGDYVTGLAATGVSLNGATIEDAHGVEASFAAANQAIDFPALDQVSSASTVDVNATTVTGLASSVTGEASAGETVELTITMSGPVTVDSAGGSPTLTLSDGATATYDANLSTPQTGNLVFDYTIGASDSSPTVFITAVTLPQGSSVQDANANPADLSGALDTPTGLAAGGPSVAMATASQSYADTGEQVELTLMMNGPVTVNIAGGPPTLSLSDGEAASYDAAASSGEDLVFDYTPRAQDQAADLTILQVNLPSGTTVEYSSGGAANADFAGEANASLGLSINSPLKVQSLASSQTGALSSGQSVTLTLTMNEQVTPMRDLSLTLSNGAMATFAGPLFTATSVLPFTYTVGPNDQASNLEIAQVNGSLADADGYNADFSAALNTPTGIAVTPVAPVLSGVPATLAYSADGSAVVLAPALTLTDSNSAVLTGASVSVSGFAGAGDVLSANTAGTSVTASYDAADELLLLSGADTLADYDRVLESVTFTGSLDPTEIGTDAGRTLTWSVYDSVNASTPQTMQLDISSDVPGVGYKPSYEAVWHAGSAGGTLEIIDQAGGDAVLASLNLSGSFAGDLFTLQSDGGSGTSIGFDPVPFTDARGGDLVFSSISGQPYQAYEDVYQGGVFEGIDYYFTDAGAAPYAAYEYDFSAGDGFIGSKFFYNAPSDVNYNSYEYDYDGSGNATRVTFTGVVGEAYSSYAYAYVGGVFSGSQFTFTLVPTGAAYTSYETDYDDANNFIGDKFFFNGIQGQSYTTEEEDLDALGDLAKVQLSGFSNAPYTSLELDFSAGTYTGYKAVYTPTGQPYTSEEIDVTATNVLAKAIYDGLDSTIYPYSSLEEDFINGALADAVYGFTNVSGQSYYAYQVKEDGVGNPLQETLDNNDGSHTILGYANGLTFASMADDVFTGGGTNETFVFNSVYGRDTITDFASNLNGAGHDTISLPTSEFANMAAVLAGSQNVGNNVVLTAANGDTITLDNMNQSALSANAGDFVFHA